MFARVVNTEPPLHTPPPWATPTDELADALGVQVERGLSSSAAARRLAESGPNTLRRIGPRSWWRILVAQFRSLLVALLVAATVAAAAFGEWIEAIAITSVLLVNAALGFVTELRATRSMEALRELGRARSTVRRDGQALIVPAEDLVVGDVVLVEGGDVITADLRLVEGSKLTADESTLTGESVPVTKTIDVVPADSAIAERSGMLWKGTIVTRGAGVGIVVATGMQSELGHISQLVADASEEATPLEQQLNRLGRGLVWIALIIAAIVAASGVIAGQSPLLIIETAIALAVAAVPEGLPVIATIALARGVRRMVDHQAIVNRLSAVETLGATNVICTDKTGTLTENRMRVAQHVFAPMDEAPRRAREIAVLCNDAAWDPPRDPIGDPMEVALLREAAEHGIDRTDLLARLPERRQVAFDPELKMMATVHGSAALFRVAVKGAPEAVLTASMLSHEQREHFLAESERLAADGLRVIALAEKQEASLDAEAFASLSFVGLVALFDPPRAQIRETIAACHRAGVRLVMVTGDHPVTARSIAFATGLVDRADATVMLGHELDSVPAPSDARFARLHDATVFARVSPRQKLDLIALHQRAGSVVAMTGDGVNDAPALRKADIGVAMGARGTAAAREASAMVLENDDLSTIVAAIGEGRVIFDNIRRFATYLLSCNLSEVLVVTIAVAAAAPLPLLPLQILFLNLVTDVFPALALGIGKGSPDIMSRAPRPKREPILTPRHWQVIAAHGLMITFSVLLSFWLALDRLALSPSAAVTVSFLTLALAQLWHVFNIKPLSVSMVRSENVRNGWLWGALALCVVLVASTVFVPVLAETLSIVAPTATAWTIIVGASVLPVIVTSLVGIGWRLARPAAAVPGSR